jgi:hypothetical protein
MFEHRTVAVKLKDQSPVAVARVEGTEAYKSLMRRAGASTARKVSHYNTWCPLYNLMTPRSIQDYLQYCSRNSDVDAVQDLLRALRRAAEAHLGHNTCIVNISLLDDTVGKGYLGQVIDAAFANLGLTQALRAVKPNAFAMVLVAEGLYDKLPEDQGLLFLIIECSSSGIINLDLPLLDNSGSMIIRRQHNVTGTIVAPQCLNDDTTASCRQALSLRRQAIREALADITTPPFGELPWAGELPTSLSRILIYGDSANDRALKEELLGLFNPKLLKHTVVQQPAYAAALGAAQQAFFRINAINYNVELPFWCCLRSWGKACPANHQRIEI